MSRELRFDFPGLRVGIAEYEEGPTGCTVFHLPPGGAACSVDIRGGSPGTIGNYEWAHAVVSPAVRSTGSRRPAASPPS